MDIPWAIGTVLSLAGIAFTLWQIHKTRRAAEAAALAATQARAAITRNVALADLAAAARSLEELKVLVRGQQFTGALFRMSDLTNQVTQLQHLGVEPPALDFKQILTQFAVLRDLLERRLHDEATKVNPAHVNRELSRISDQLNDWIGSRKYLIDRGDT